MENVDKINEGSIQNIVFLNNSDSLEKLGQYKNLLFTKQGMYQVQENLFGRSFSKLNIPYKNLLLKDIDLGQEKLDVKIKKPKKEILQYIIDCFKFVQKKSKNELLINVYYNIKKDDFKVELPVNQIISGANDKYNYNEMEFDENYVRYLQIHSHHSMSPSPSSDDNNHEQNMLCFYGIIGNLNQGTDINNVSYTFRYWTGVPNHFVYVQKEDVFDFPKVKKNDLDSETLGKLNYIIKNSQKEKKKNNKTPICFEDWELEKLI